MNKKESQEFKKKLISLRERISEEIKHLGENGGINKSQRDASGDLSAYTFHMADVASDSYEREFSWDRLSGEQQEIVQIDDALKRIEEGTYGKCEGCGGKIKKERLKALPHCKMCLKCKKEQEEKKG
ncbi:MAG: TraR/DksA family transcriptional regulator [PVC group bacterium]|nr:TraR/DksA family transcriptional regulator [PVC group bacterium]